MTIRVQAEEALRGVYRNVRGHLLQRLIVKSRLAFNPRRPVEIVGYLSMAAGVGRIRATLRCRALARGP